MLHISPYLTAYILGIAFVLGAVFASFLGCLGWRMCKGESVIKGRSHCDTCGHLLGGRDLIPIFSYLFRGGKCAYCKAPIPKSSFVGEVLLAVLFAASALMWDITPILGLNLFFICILFLVTLTDLYEQIIPDACLVVAIAVRLLYYFFIEGFGTKSFIYLIASGFYVALPLLLLTLLLEKLWKKEAMGGGDIKLIFVTGLYLGWKKNLLMILIACIVGIMIGSLQMSKKEENYFPFGPAIAIATVVCMFVGDGILGWYLSLYGM